MNKKEKIKDLHRYFLYKIKPRKPIILRFSKIMKCHGSYSYYDQKHYITLNFKDNLITLIDNWVHEVSHCIQKSKYGKESHSDEWGKCFSKIYRIYLDWDKECNK